MSYSTSLRAWPVASSTMQPGILVPSEQEICELPSACTTPSTLASWKTTPGPASTGDFRYYQRYIKVIHKTTRSKFLLMVLQSRHIASINGAVATRYAMARTQHEQSLMHATLPPQMCLPLVPSQVQTARQGSLVEFSLQCFSFQKGHGPELTVRHTPLQQLAL